MVSLFAKMYSILKNYKVLLFLYKKHTLYLYYIGQQLYIYIYIAIASTTKSFINGRWLYVWLVYTNLLKRKIKKKKSDLYAWDFMND